MKFAHLAQRLFNTPLAIAPGKAEVVMAALYERLGVTQIARSGNFAMGADDDHADYSAPGDTHRVGYAVVMGVAIIRIEGTLVHKLGCLEPWSGMTGYDGIRQNFLTALMDPNVDAIMLDICSPGGEVSGCFDLVDLIYESRGKKMVWAILTEYAYSAGYAIASAADQIYLPRTGGVGSIGVIWMHVDWSRALDIAGMKVTYLTYGDSKADGNAEFPLSDDARKRFQADITAAGELFVGTVARNRGLETDLVMNTQAATYMGNAGVELGLADGVLAPDAAFRKLLLEVKKMKG